MGGVLLLITNSNHSLKSAFDGFVNKKRSINDGDLHPAKCFCSPPIESAINSQTFCFCVIVVIWKKQRDSCVTFYRDVIRFAFQQANMSVKFD